jgi:hypothetical protein
MEKALVLPQKYEVVAQDDRIMIYDTKARKATIIYFAERVVVKSNEINKKTAKRIARFLGLRDLVKARALTDYFKQ